MEKWNRRIFLLLIAAVYATAIYISDFQSDDVALKNMLVLLISISPLAYYAYSLMLKPGASLPGSRERKIASAICFFIFIILNLSIFFIFFLPFL
jgi:hypothetical protein